MHRRIAWAVREGLAWLGRAQDSSATQDGGVARHYCRSALADTGRVGHA